MSVAAQEGHLPALQLLLDKGAAMEVKATVSQTILMDNYKYTYCISYTRSFIMYSHIDMHFHTPILVDIHDHHIYNVVFPLNDTVLRNALCRGISFFVVYI